MSNEKITYKSAGVDTEAGRSFVDAIKKNVHSTHNPRVLGGLGGFAAAYDVSFLKNYKNPVLLSCTDGVGTKLELARLLDIHNTVGIDLVAMSVNDLLVSGAQPLFFLDYIACGKLDVQKMESIVSGIVEGCRQCGAALVGGETAEHPGTMKADEYDMAGFAVGAVEKEELIDGSKIQTGDVLIGLESSGPHSNGFSLLRRLFLKEGKYLPDDKDAVNFIRDYLFKPTRIYVEPVLQLIRKEEVRGMIHITGGGFYENIPRILKKDQAVHIIKKNIPESYVFGKVKKDHNIEDRELFSTFNMGVGFIVIVSKQVADSALRELNARGENAFILGEVIAKKSEEVEIV